MLRYNGFDGSREPGVVAHGITKTLEYLREFKVDPQKVKEYTREFIKEKARWNCKLIELIKKLKELEQNEEIISKILSS